MQLSVSIIRGVGVGAGLAVLSTCGGDSTAPDGNGNGGDPAAPVSVQISGAASVNIAGTTQLTAQPMDGSGGNVNAAVAWSSANTAVATVSPAGLVTGVTRGTARVTATVTGTSVAASRDITVTVASVAIALSADSAFSFGDTITVTATARDEDGAVVPGVPFLVSVISGTAVSVLASGNVVASANGDATVRAAADNRTADAGVTVSQRAVALNVSPAAATIDETAMQQFTAEEQDARGNAIAGTSASWTSTSTAVATVDAMGVATADTSGVTSIIAASGGFADTATLTVQEPTLSGSVQPILTMNCALAGCHGIGAGGPQQGMFLVQDSTHTYTVNVASMELPGMMRIRPTLPDSSYLVHKIQGTQTSLNGCGGGACGAQMPFGNPPLSQTQIDLIRRWILRGAKDN